MSRKGDIVIKSLLDAIFPRWQREQQRCEVAKLKFGESTSKSMKKSILKNPGKLSM